MSVAFERIMELCRKPSLAAMREVLENQDGLSDEEKRFVTYVTSFSHYPESFLFLKRPGLDLLTQGPAVYDPRANALHVKVFIAEITHTLKRLSVSHLSEAYGVQVFNNIVFSRSSEGNYVESFGNPRERMTYLEYLRYMEIHSLGIREQVVSHPFDGCALSLDSIVFHFATQNIRNLLQDLPRFFMDGHSIIFCNDRDSQINLSIKNLRAARETHVWLKSMFWYVIENPLAAQVVEFVEELGGRYKVIPFQGQDGDYLPEIISDITTSLSKLKIPR